MTKPGFFSHDHPAYPAHITANVILTTFLAILSSVVTMIADSSIQGELALSNTEAIWLTTLYLLGVNLTVPTANWFANQFGYNRVYTYGIAIFTLASLMAGLSVNFFTIASARLIEGVGAGFIFPVGLALVVKSMPAKKMSLAINLYIALAFGGGLSLGAPISGFFAQFYSWRTIFFLIFPFGALSIISCWLSRKKIPELHKSPFDFLGFLTFALFIASLLIALTLGPIRATPQGWRTPYIIALFAIALLSLILFLYRETKAKSPLFPLTLFKDPIFSVSLAAMFLLGMATFTGVSVSTEYMLKALLYEKFTTGKIAAIYGLVIGFVSVISSYLSKIIPLAFLTFSGLILLVLSDFYNNELSFLTGYLQVIAILVIRGTGVGLALGPTTTLAVQQIADPLKAQAATILTFFRQIGGTYGGTLIAIFSIRRTIFHTQRFAEEVNPQLPAYQITLQKLYDKFPDPEKGKLAIIQNIKTQAFIQGLNDSFIIFGYVTAFVTAILILLIGYRALRKTLQKQRF